MRSRQPFVAGRRSTKHDSLATLLGTPLLDAIRELIREELAAGLSLSAALAKFGAV